MKLRKRGGKECIIKAKRENESMLTHANHVIAKDTKVNVSHGQLHVKVSSFFLRTKHSFFPSLYCLVLEPVNLSVEVSQ